jgi:hypothetical protein
LCACNVQLTGRQVNTFHPLVPLLAERPARARRAGGPAPGLARRSISAASSAGIGGRPVWCGYVHLRVTSRRCQRSTVPVSPAGAPGVSGEADESARPVSPDPPRSTAASAGYGAAPRPRAGAQAARCPWMPTNDRAGRASHTHERRSDRAAAWPQLTIRRRPGCRISPGHTPGPTCGTPRTGRCR